MTTSAVPLRENEIRPDALMKQQAQHFANDVARLMQHQANFVEVACPACAATKPREVFQKLGLRYQECQACGTVYTSPRPRPEHLQEYYTLSENYAFWNQHIFPASEATRRERIFRPRARRIADICRTHQVNPGVLLEVGAGFGTFCEEMRAVGLFGRLIAVEPTPGLAQTCRQRGLEVLEQPIESVRLDEPVDMVAAFEVIEHLFDPRAFIAACQRQLRPGGLLVLSCPNIRGFDVATLGPLSSAVDPEHLNYFHPDSLSHLVESCGFQTLDLATPGELDAELVRKKVLAGDFSLSGQPFLQRVLIDEWDRLGGPFQNFLAANRLSSHLWIVAKKN